MGESENGDIEQILAFLEDRCTDEQAQAVAARLKTDRAFAQQLAVQARICSGLETLSRVQALTPEALADALKATAEDRPKNIPKSAARPAAKKVVRLPRTAAAGRNTREWVRWALAAVALLALAGGGWWLANRGPQPQVAVTPEPLEVTRVQLAQVEFVPAQLAEKDRPVVIHGQGENAKSEAVQPGMAIYAGDRLVTLKSAGAGSGNVQVSLKSTQGAAIDVGADSELIFPTQMEALDFPIGRSGFELTRGRLFVDTRQSLVPPAIPPGPAVANPVAIPAQFTIRTPSAQMESGTSAYELISGPTESIARVQSGLVKVINDLGTQVVHEFEECVVAVKNAPAAPVTIYARLIWAGRHGGGGMHVEPGANVALAGRLTLERPTLLCLGAHWVIRGDDNRNAVAWCRYRAVNTGRPTGEWRRSLDFWRIDAGGWPDGYRPIQANEALLAGSLFDLQEDTEYELEFHLEDPDGQNAVRVLHARTRRAPQAVADGRRLQVIPDSTGTGGGAGTVADPFRGLAAADTAARPGDTLLLAPGLYQGTWTVTADGEPGRPIVWQGAADGASILEGIADNGKPAGRVISANRRHDLIFNGLTVRGGDYLLVAHGAQRISVTGCRLSDCRCAITGGPKDTPVEDFYIADNTFTGTAVWPTENKGEEKSRAIYLGGQGHVICHNRLTNFGDGIDTAGPGEVAAVDIYLNDLSAMTDDAIEIDFSYRNVRCFRNRITNVFQGISAQPVYGGPAYIFRNTLFNVELEALKLHSSPNGVWLVHNTSVKTGPAAVLSTSDPVYHCVSRNNLFIGTTGGYGLLYDAPMLHCDFDYDGVGGSFDKFLLWNRVAVATLADAQARGGAEQHATEVAVNGCFADGTQPPTGEIAPVPVGTQDLRLAAGSQAVDRGAVLPGINENYQGQAPDLGAFEVGEPLPAYGPRPAAAP